MRFWYLTLSCQRSGIIFIDFQAKPDIWSDAPSSSDLSHVCFRSEERSLVGGNTAVSVTIDQKCLRVASDAFDSCNDRLLSGFSVQTRTNKGRKRRLWCRPLTLFDPFYPSQWPWGATEILHSWKRDRKQSNTTILVTVLVSVCYKYMKLTYWRADGVQVGSLPPLPTQTFSYHPFNDIWIKTLKTRIALNLKISI